MQGTECFLKSNTKIVCREEEDGALLFDSETGTIRILNQTGFEIWKLCDGTFVFEQIIDKLEADYPDAVAKTIEKDVSDFINYMDGLGLIGKVLIKK